MTNDPQAHQKLLEAELDVLRAMVQGTPARVVRAEGIKILADYPFQDSVHQLVFDTLREIPGDSSEIIREQLPARLNNKGFPDLDLEALFQPHNLTPAQAIALMRSLRSKDRHAL